MLTNKIFFQKLVFLSVLLIYLVILAGGIVRSTGSGMGCPDWPRCFGQWVPPTKVSELPPDYKERFKVGNHTIAEFNAFKTWIEYTNRLLGVLVGISVFVTFWYSLRFWGSDNTAVWLAFSILILTGFQGWIGAKVVSSNLSKHMITVHMLIALVIMGLALYLYFLSNEGVGIASSNFSKILLFMSILTFIQVLVGTQVRQQIDTVAVAYNDTNRNMWISQLDKIFTFHQVLAVVVVVANACLSFFIIKSEGLHSLIAKLSLVIVLLLVLEYAFGVIMVRWGIPFYAQPIHLFLATIVFGLQFYAWLLSRPRLNYVVK